MRRFFPVVSVMALLLAPGPAAAEVLQERGERSRVGRAASYDIYDVDPQDPRERFAVLLPGGPLVVEAVMTIDGAPFRLKRDALVDGALAGADSDGNGEVTWQEMLVAPPCSGMIIERQHERFVRMLDWNRDGAVGFWEGRGLLTALYDGPAFLVSSGAVYETRRVNGPIPRPSDVFGLLDLDDDDVLTETEIANAGETLINSDTDRNRLLHAGEIGSRNSSHYQSRRRIHAVAQHSILIDPVGTLLFIAIRDRYATDEGPLGPDAFWRVPERFEELDVDGDRELTEQEVAALNDAEPDLRVTVDFSGDASESSLVLTGLNYGRVRTDDNGDGTLVECRGARLRLVASSFPDLPSSYEAVVGQVFVQWDHNGDGYLDPSELLADQSKGFSKWDRDNDGKVFLQEFAREFVDYQIESLSPRLTQIMVDVSPVRDPLLSVLDFSGDSRLSHREVNTAGRQLAPLDADADGKVTRREVPVSCVVDFRIGGRSFAIDPTPVIPAPERPEWFVRMDRNGDGDVTPGEFFGDQNAFRKLDTNSDGFIEPAEARAAAERESETN